MCVFVAGPVLSVDSVMAVLKGCHQKWREVGDCLDVPSSFLDILEADISTDKERLSSIVRYWLLRDPKISWRKFTWRLDWSNSATLHQCADDVRHFAEKLSGE